MIRNVDEFHYPPVQYVKFPTMINLVLHVFSSVLPLLTEAFFLGVFHASSILMQLWLRSVKTLRSMSRARPMAFRKIVWHRCNESGVDESFFGSSPKIVSLPSNFIIDVVTRNYIIYRNYIIICTHMYISCHESSVTSFFHYWFTCQSKIFCY